MTLKPRVGATVEVIGTVDAMYHPTGHVTPELAKHLGLDPDAGWRMSEVNTTGGGDGSKKLVTVKLFRSVH